MRHDPPAASEEDPVRRIARGDAAAFEELYRRTSPRLAVRLRRRCADEEILADVLQAGDLSGGMARVGVLRGGNGRRQCHRVAVDGLGYVLCGPAGLGLPAGPGNGRR
ncbi:RNA polymerase sigma factor [Plantactinospora sp. WMMB334]|uniref:RNA polymerase sigma factor n=1 Tax=Plantactinospora sp. WMMB334 TaxID=3404119 RepID=UPI003B935FD0